MNLQERISRQKSVFNHTEENIKMMPAYGIVEIVDPVNYIMSVRDSITGILYEEILLCNDGIVATPVVGSSCMICLYPDKFNVPPVVLFFDC